MKRLKWWLPFLILVVVVTACGEKEDQKHKDNDVSMEAVEVELHSPESVTLGEESQFEAEVRQGDEKVEDAEEVMFEIWKEGSKEESVMLEASNDGEGRYSVNHTFEQEGFYFVQSHVTARDMHTMPKKKVVVSN